MVWNAGHKATRSPQRVKSKIDIHCTIQCEETTHFLNHLSKGNAGHNIFLQTYGTSFKINHHPEGARINAQYTFPIKDTPKDQ